MTEVGVGPQTEPELFTQLIDRVVRQLGEVLVGYADRLDVMEDELEREEANVLPRNLADLRSESVSLRRYIAPQREALGHRTAEPPVWLGEEHRPTVREAADRQQRYLEEMDASRGRSVVIKNDLINRLNQTMNKNMYAISVIAAIFLPLSFLTGLLGINVGGMPGVENSFAFWITCIVMVILLVVQVWLFRKL
ncbi:MAG: CorA family divalent cation transporter, partial [Pseudomonadota bacterium]